MQKGILSLFLSLSIRLKKYFNQFKLRKTVISEDYLTWLIRLYIKNYLFILGVYMCAIYAFVHGMCVCVFGIHLIF